MDRSPLSASLALCEDLPADVAGKVASTFAELSEWRPDLAAQLDAAPLCWRVATNGVGKLGFLILRHHWVEAARQNDVESLQWLHRESGALSAVMAHRDPVLKAALMNGASRAASWLYGTFLLTKTLRDFEEEHENLYGHLLGTGKYELAYKLSNDTTCDAFDLVADSTFGRWLLSCDHKIVCINACLFGNLSLLQFMYSHASREKQEDLYGWQFLHPLIAFTYGTPHRDILEWLLALVPHAPVMHMVYANKPELIADVGDAPNASLILATLFCDLPPMRRPSNVHLADVGGAPNASRIVATLFCDLPPMRRPSNVHPDILLWLLSQVPEKGRKSTAEGTMYDAVERGNTSSFVLLHSWLKRHYAYTIRDRVSLLMAGCRSNSVDTASSVLDAVMAETTLHACKRKFPRALKWIAVHTVIGCEHLHMLRWIVPKCYRATETRAAWRILHTMCREGAPAPNAHFIVEYFGLTRTSLPGLTQMLKRATARCNYSVLRYLVAQFEVTPEELLDTKWYLNTQIRNPCRSSKVALTKKWLELYCGDVRRARAERKRALNASYPPPSLSPPRWPRQCNPYV